MTVKRYDKAPRAFPPYVPAPITGHPFEQVGRDLNRELMHVAFLLAGIVVLAGGTSYALARRLLRK